MVGTRGSARSLNEEDATPTGSTTGARGGGGGGERDISPSSGADGSTIIEVEDTTKPGTRSNKKQQKYYCAPAYLLLVHIAVFC